MPTGTDVLGDRKSVPEQVNIRKSVLEIVTFHHDCCDILASLINVKSTLTLTDHFVTCSQLNSGDNVTRCLDPHAFGARYLSMRGSFSELLAPAVNPNLDL